MKTKLLNCCCELFGVHQRDLLGPARFDFLTTARFAMYKALHMRGWSHARVGRFMDRDRTTVAYGVVRATEAMARSEEYSQKVQQIADLVDVDYGWQPSPQDVFNFVCSAAGETPVIVRRTANFVPSSYALVCIAAKVSLDADMPVSTVARTLRRAASTARKMADEFEGRFRDDDDVQDLFERTRAQFPKKGVAMARCIGQG